MQYLRRPTFSTIKKCYSLTTQPIATNQIAITSKLLHDTTPVSSIRFASKKVSAPPRLGLRKQNLPPYPHIECVRSLNDVESFLPSNYKFVKHGDYEFLHSTDGYAQIYIQGYQNEKHIDSKSGYAVYFGSNHPLNLKGSVERRQAMNHAKLYAFLRGIQQIPVNLIDKLCICVDELPLITFIDQSLRNMSENSFRSVHTGKLNKDLETSIEINKLLRLRNDFTLRLKYVPNNIGIEGMYHATKISKNAAVEATREARIKRCTKQ